ncbi:MFS transporter [Actinopolyspora mortivallis]|uniref:Major facilitator superfamily (MFS) profile domain-containing protein n=1 Tax=Actinopolyspora mortivallis TaxID=33906 RepID=A0A2T0GYM2_ACTMO|nr:MFS transporter [Actinopolyspora mortivallis]PRW64218.1 hypothetical protein CEP50_06160 [Actinopolyspora mortivallis]
MSLSASATAHEPLRGRRDGAGTAVTLVLTGMLTIMAGATVAPAIPGIREAFAGTPNVDLLARMITTMHALAIVVFSPVAGRMVERLGGKRSLLLGMTAFGVGGSSGAYLPGLISILAGRIVLGVGVALVMTGGITMIANLYEGDRRRKLMGRQAAASSFGGVILLVGGGALAELEWRVVFLIYLFGLLLAIPTALFLPADGPSESDGSGKSPGRRGRLPAAVVAALVGMLLGQIIFYSIPVQVPFLAESDFGASSTLSGTLIAVQTFTTGVVGMRYDFFRRMGGEWTLTAFSFLGNGIGFAVLAFADSIGVLIAGLLVLGTGLGILIPNINNWVMSEADESVRGRYAGLITTFLFFGQFLAPLVTQPIVGRIGIQPMFGVISVIALAVCVLYFVLGSVSRRRGTVSA